MKAEMKPKLKLEGRTNLESVIPLATPYLIYLDPSSACNFKCSFCPTGHKDLVTESDYTRSVMSFSLFEKFIDNLSEFDRPIRVLRMNKIGEPLLNKRLPDMIRIAKKSGYVDYIDLATNAALLNPNRAGQLIEAGIDRINVSLEGVNEAQYLEHAKVKINFDEFVDNIHWLYANKHSCELTIKVPGNYLSEDNKKEFFDTFGDWCDRIFVEELAPIWPEFDLEDRTGLIIQTDRGQYQQGLEEKSVCTYIFYAMAVNADGTVSACCPDWDQKLLIGDLNTDSVKDIWNSNVMLELRKQHLRNDRKENPVCKNCGHIKHAQVDSIDSFAPGLLTKLSQVSCAT